jgi:uncharacterized protein Smg (DUF494 family)
MKAENVLSILMYLFKHHIKNSDEATITSEEELVDELESAGFHKPAIESALDWIGNLSSNELTQTQLQSPWSRRILTHEELFIFDKKCQSYFLFLQEEKILNPIGVELVISQLLDLNTAKVDVGLIQWVTLMFLYNQDNQDEALRKMELLVLQEKPEVLH